MNLCCIFPNQIFCLFECSKMQSLVLDSKTLQTCDMCDVEVGAL